jgi:hypothetical protein
MLEAGEEHVRQGRGEETHTQWKEMDAAGRLA